LDQIGLLSQQGLVAGVWAVVQQAIGPMHCVEISLLRKKTTHLSPSRLLIEGLQRFAPDAPKLTGLERLYRSQGRGLRQKTEVITSYAAFLKKQHGSFLSLREGII